MNGSQENMTDRANVKQYQLLNINKEYMKGTLWG